MIRKFFMGFLAVLLLCGLLFAVRATLTPITPKGPYPGTVAAGDLDVTWTAADVSNKNEFTSSGHDLLLIYNSGASAYTVTLTSVPLYGRSADITAYSLDASDVAAFWFGQGALGWTQTGGKVYIEANNVAIKFAVIRIP